MARIFWQSFVDAEIGRSYLDRLQAYLNDIAAPGTEVTVSGMTPPDRDFGRLSELRCGIQAIGAGIDAEKDGYDCYVMGHFQDPCLYDLRATISIPVVGVGESTLLAASQLGRRIGLVTLDPAFEVWHLEQVELYGLGDRVKFVTGLGSTPQEFDRCFAGDAEVKAKLLDDFARCAMPMVESGADVIVPAGVLPGLLVAGARGLKVGGAPVVNCASVALKSAEMWIQLHKLDQLEPNRGPGFKLAPERAKNDFKALISGGATNRTNNGDAKMADKLVYTAEVTSTGGRDGGHSKASDGKLEVSLSMPKEFGGPGGDGTNPEQLFAAAWSACFLSATKLAARLAKVALPQDPVITAKIGVLSGDGYYLNCELNVSLPGLEESVARQIVEDAHKRCPFSKATRGNVDVVLNLV